MFWVVRTADDDALVTVVCSLLSLPSKRVRRCMCVRYVSCIERSYSYRKHSNGPNANVCVLVNDTAICRVCALTTKHCTNVVHVFIPVRTINCVSMLSFSYIHSISWSVKVLLIFARSTAYPFVAVLKVCIFNRCHYSNFPAWNQLDLLSTSDTLVSFCYAPLIPICRTEIQINSHFFFISAMEFGTLILMCFVSFIPFLLRKLFLPFDMYAVNFVFVITMTAINVNFASPPKKGSHRSEIRIRISSIFYLDRIEKVFQRFSHSNKFCWHINNQRKSTVDFDISFDFMRKKMTRIIERSKSQTLPQTISLVLMRHFQD